MSTNGLDPAVTSGLAAPPVTPDPAAPPNPADEPQAPVGRTMRLARPRLGRPSATAAEVDAAVTAAGLGPVVGGLPAGLATLLGERGVGLSAGERQRVALARAFLRDAPLLLLDEPTASLDGEVEAEVLAAVRRLAEGRTVLLVAHRPALAALADRVVAMDHAGLAV